MGSVESSDILSSTPVSLRHSKGKQGCTYMAVQRAGGKCIRCLSMFPEPAVLPCKCLPDMNKHNQSSAGRDRHRVTRLHSQHGHCQPVDEKTRTKENPECDVLHILRLLLKYIHK
ncbi:unnamed protein product [Caretta caretta]